MPTTEHAHTLTDDEAQRIAHHCRIAAERYTESAKTMRAEPAHERLAQQFDRQAADALALAERLEA